MLEMCECFHASSLTDVQKQPVGLGISSVISFFDSEVLEVDV